MSQQSLGALRRRFTLEAPVAGPDGLLAFQILGAAWGAVETTREGVRVRLRTRRDVAPGCRLRLGSRLFEIVERRRDETASGAQLCLCREMFP